MLTGSNSPQRNPIPIREKPFLKLSLLNPRDIIVPATLTDGNLNASCGD
jgi:hypothetical protein